MENCLVTKLKSVVDNDNLRKLGELRFKMAQSGAFTVTAVSDDSFKLVILTPGVTFTAPSLAAGTTEQTVPATASRNFSVSGACELAIYNKYALRIFTSDYYAYLNFDELTGTENIQQLRFGAYQNLSKGDVIKSINKNTGITSLMVKSTNTYGDLKDLVESSTLYNIELTGDISGDIANLSRLSHLADLKLQSKPRLYGNVSVFENISDIRDISFLNSPGIVGSISSFANHSSLRNPQLYGTGITGTLGELLVGTPALKNAYLPVGVKWTDADAAIADERMQANGGSITSIGHYFGGGTHVDSYS